ncbi:MAG TPA: hypothetical protein VFZ47_03835 [Chitinophagaceae bacterium]
MKSLLLLIFTGMSISGFGQRFSGYAAVGLGSSLEDNIQGITTQNRSRFIGSMTLYCRATERLSIGAEANASGGFNLFNRSSSTIDDGEGNTLQLTPSNLKAGSILLRNKILLFSWREIEPFIDLGFGLNTFYYSDPVQNIGTIKKTRFVFSPEFGINIYKFQFACKLIKGGKTPSFTGTDPATGKTVTLQSVKADQVYLTIGYQLFRL